MRGIIRYIKATLHSIITLSHYQIITLAVAFFIFACREPAYYVSTSGDDENPGTRDRPFRTVAKVNTLKLKSGESVYFEGGSTFEGTLDLVLEGKPGDSVMISSYGSKPATINGNKAGALIIRGRYFTIRNLHALGAGRKTGNTSNGIRLIDASFAKVQNVQTAGFQKSGLELYNCQDVIVRGVVAIDNGFCGINVTGADQTKSRNVLVQDCHAENNAGDPTVLGNHSGNGILVSMSDSVVVDHCSATNNGWDMPRIGNGPVGIWAFESNNIVIQYCISYKNRTPPGAKDGGGFDFDGGVRNSIIQYCLSYENDGAGYGLFQYDGASPWKNNTVRYCVSVNDAKATEGAGGFFVWNGARDSTQLADGYIHNNLVYASGAPAVVFEASSLNQHFVFSNNIFVGGGEIVCGPSTGGKFRGNVWWGKQIYFFGNPSLAEWAQVTGQETSSGKMVGIQTDPKFIGSTVIDMVDPYKLSSLEVLKLKTNSPLKDAGVPWDNSFGLPLPIHDFFGTPVPQNGIVDPGIFEFPETK